MRQKSNSTPVTSERTARPSSSISTFSTRSSTRCQKPRLRRQHRAVIAWPQRGNMAWRFRPTQLRVGSSSPPQSRSQF